MAARQRASAGFLAAALLGVWARPGGAQELVVPLPAPAVTGRVTVEEALQQRRSVRAFAPHPLGLADAAQLLWAAQGRTTASGLRTAPSAGALYPLNVYLAAGRVDGLAPALYRYDSAAHTLIRQRAGDPRGEIAAAARGQAWIGTAPAMLVITAVPERTARKYGERALRYVHIEVGHVSQAVYLQAAARGLGTTFVGAFDDERVRLALRLSPGHLVVGLMPLGPTPRGPTR